MLRPNAVIPLLLLGIAGFALPQSQLDVVSLEGPQSVDVDINGDGIGDLVFANYTFTGTAHSYFSYSINIRDGTDRDLLHSVHVYPDDYGSERGLRLRLLDRRGSPESLALAHFLIRGNDDESYELLTAEKIDNRFPPRPGTVEFTFHRFRVDESVGPAYYIFDGHRKVKSTGKHCDVVKAADKEVFALEGGPDDSGNGVDPQ